MKRFLSNLIISIRFWLAKREADHKHRTTGKRYYVLNAGTRFIVVDNYYVKKYNKKVKHKSQRITFTDMIKMCDYMTRQKGLVR